MAEEIKYRVPIVRLVGIWRFLTPMDTIQVGDYSRARFMGWTYQPQWVPTNLSSVWYSMYFKNKRVADFPNMEFIRGAPNESSIFIEYIDIVRRTKDSALEEYVDRLSHQVARIPKGATK